MSDCGYVHDDGAYVLGALSPANRVAFERHLASCPGCARSVRELAGLPGLLARVPAEVADTERRTPPPVPDTLLPALVRRVRSTQRRRTWLSAGLVGVAATVAVGALAVATLGNGDGAPAATPTPSSAAAPTTAPAEVMRPAGDEPISGWISLTPVGWGTRLDLTCSYATESHDYDDPSWSTYTMYVRTGDGGVERVASWKALPGKTMKLTAATAADREDITGIEVRTSAGDTVLELS